MIRSHVFVVNENTLPIHLKYNFVGTGSGGKDKNISLLSDMFRVKKDDYIFFYIEGNSNKRGRFLGIYKATDNEVYHLHGDDAYNPNLPLKLIYRKRITPYKVYSSGVLEWIVLDKLPKYSSEIIWMLIYRKMKGKRGNTMLFPWESQRLINMLAKENDGKTINYNNYYFDKLNFKITNSCDCSELNKFNLGSKIELSFTKKDINSETAFQGYILKNLEVPNNKFLYEIFVGITHFKYIYLK